MPPVPHWCYLAPAVTEVRVFLRCVRRPCSACTRSLRRCAALARGSQTDLHHGMHSGSCQSGQPRLKWNASLLEQVITCWQHCNYRHYLTCFRCFMCSAICALRQWQNRAGVVGLACARALAMRGLDVIIVEKEGAFGTATSSRNSEGG